MSHQGENVLIVKLKQSIIEKQYSQKFAELMNPNIRLNRDERATQIDLVAVNKALPSISNAKIPITIRTKSQSSKRLPSKVSQQKLTHQRSSKRLYKEPKQLQNGNKRIDLEGLLMKKQSILQSVNKQSSIRSKVFSLKTPLKDEERLKDISGTKDISNTKIQSLKKTGQKQIIVRQFITKIEKLNEELLLTVKSGKIDAQGHDNKKIFTNLHKLKATNEDQYNKYNRALQKITKFIDRFNIQYGIIEFKNIIKISHRQVLSNFQLVSLFTNKADIIKGRNIAGLNYYTIPQDKGKELAAFKITAFFKMIFSKRFYKKFRGLLGKVLIIQRYWRTCLLVKRTRRKVLQSIENKLAKHENLQRQLAKQWPIIKSSNRYQIHICSYSLEQFKRLTTKNIKQRQNNQIPRIFKALETDVNIIYVSPFGVHEEIIKYYNSIFQFNSSMNQEKLYFISPQNKHRFEEHSLSTTSLLLYSPKALKRIKQIIGKQYAYIVSSFPSVQYVNLSAELNIPILSSNQNLSKLFSTKSGCNKIFKNIANKQKPPFHVPKSVQSIFSEKQLINSLAILIYKNKHVKCWYLKIEDQIHSRGLAYLNINKISFLRQLCSGETEFKEVEEKQMITLIAEQLTNKLSIRLKILNRDIYSTYEQYLSHFLTRGGIVQAGIEGEKLTPFSISFFIDPVGEFNMIGTYNKLELGGKSICQSIKFPSIVENIDYEVITRALYKQLWVKRKLFGYFTADFLTSEMFILPYAIGLDCFLNEKTSSIFMVNYCGETRYNKDKNILFSPKYEEQHYIYCPIISLLKLPSTNLFFKSCKYENISYDLQKKLGTIFVLLDQLENQQLSFFTLQKDTVTLLKQVKHILEFFSKNYRQSKSTHDDIGLLKGAITIWLKRFQKEKMRPPQPSNLENAKLNSI